MNDRKVASLITAYKKLRETKPDALLEDCRNGISLTSVINMAATARGLSGKKHMHQRRVNGMLLERFAQSLTTQCTAIAAASSFDDLLRLVQKCACGGIGSLTTYDTAHRIGSFLKIHPDKVHLHSGTRTGAENLLGKIHAPYLLLPHLPAILQGSGLSAAELEDFFCVYKDRLRACV